MGVVRTRDLFTRTQKIDRFVYNKILPNNIDTYEPLGENEHLCPFCDEQHFGYKEITCDEQYLIVVEENNSDVDVAHSYNSSFSKFTCCEECASDLNERVWEDLTEERNTKVGDMTYRLKQYIFAGKLIDGHIWAKSDLKYHACFFCKDSIQLPVLPEEEIMVPVGSTDCGGMIYSCQACAQAYQKDSTRHFLHTDICFVCEQEYPITEEFNQQKVFNQDFKKAMCPKCYEELYDITKDDKILCEANCAKCSTVKIQDRRYHNAKIFHNYVNLCITCQTTEDFLYIIKRGDPVRYWAGVVEKSNQPSKLFKFEIHKCIPPGEIEKSIKVWDSETKHLPNKDVFVVTEQAIATLDYFYEPLQLV